MNEKQVSIHFRLDPRSSLAPYRQLVDQVRAAVIAGRLRGGDQLPSVRDVVAQVTINPNTVHRAYRELEHLGLAEGRLGLGTFVVGSGEGVPRDYRAQSWRDVLRESVALARSSGVADDEIVDSVRGLLASDAEAHS